MWTSRWDESSRSAESMNSQTSPPGYNMEPYHPPSPILYSSSSSSPAISPTDFLTPTVPDYGTETAPFHSTTEKEEKEEEEKMEVGGLIIDDSGAPHPSCHGSETGSLTRSTPLPSVAEQAEQDDDSHSSPASPILAAEQASDYTGGPSTPPPSPASSQDDEVDGWLSTTLIDVVKTALLHLFNITCLKHIKETCHGCIIDHPSQRQHQCLEKPEEDFYQLHFYRIMRKLMNPRFIPAVQNLVKQHNLNAEDPVVKVIAETVLCELKSAFRFQSAISDMYDEMTEEKLRQLRCVSECYSESDD